MSNITYKPNLRSFLLLCLLFSGYCGIVSELSLFNLGTMLLGGTNTTLLYTMGIMMFSMGVGSYLTETSYFKNISFDHFALVEIFLSLFCMISVPVIHYLTGMYPRQSVWFFIFFSGMIGLLIGMEIPIIMRLNQKLGLDLEQNSARVMMADYFGSLLAFVLFPFILFPKLGVNFSAFSGGLINLVVAFGTFVAGYSHFYKKKLTGILLLILCAISILLGLNLPNLAQNADQKLFRDPIIFRQNTPYQRLVVTKKNPFKSEDYTLRLKETGIKLFENKDKRFELIRFEETFSNDIRFFINGGLQFSTIDEYRYHEVLTHPAKFLADKVSQALILGGGDGLVARELLKYKDIQHILLVDLDKELTDLFQKSDLAKLNNFALRDPKLQIVNRDAIVFLRELGNQKFPLIIIDFPDPYNLHTAKLYTRQFYELVKSVLAPNGILVLQATSPLFNRKSFLCIGNTLEKAGFNAMPMKVNMRTFEDWGFYLASTTHTSSDLKSKLTKFTLKPQVPTRFLDEQAIKSCLNFGKDVFFDRDKYRFNDLNRLVLVQYYKDGLF